MTDDQLFGVFLTLALSSLFAITAMVLVAIAVAWVIELIKRRR